MRQVHRCVLACYDDGAVFSNVLLLTFRNIYEERDVCPCVILQTKAFVRNNGKYLLLRKVRDVHKDHVGQWEVPGGKCKDGESPEVTVLREIGEETGLTGVIVGELEPLELKKDGIVTKTHIYVVETSQTHVVVSAEHDTYLWVTVAEAEKLDNLVYRDLFVEKLYAAHSI